jgi:predicted lipid carrier protein YhbT
MATQSEVQGAVDSLVARLAAVDPDRLRHLPDRTIGVTLLDLDVTYIGDLRQGRLTNVRKRPANCRPQVRLICDSDDLVALNEGRLHFAHAWATGRVRLDASLRDLLRLRALA